MQEYQNPQQEERNFFRGRKFRNFEEHRARKRFGFGVVILVIGLIVLLRQLGFETLLPIRHFWPYILIIIGLVLGISNKFRSAAPFILLIIGIAHAVPAFHFHLGDQVVYSKRLVAPLVLIGAGLYFLFVSKKKSCFSQGCRTPTNDQNYVIKDVIFGGSKEIITSKSFEGGDVTAVFGGAELNFTQAEMAKDTAVLNVRTVFGGCEIIVPSNWEVKSEVTVLLGSVEDQRTLRMTDGNIVKKTLVLRGLCLFGGVEVKSY